MKNNYIVNSFKLIKNNIKTVIGFEMIFKLIVSLIIIPLSMAGFNYVMNLTGYTYITGENLVSFLIHPFNILYILLLKSSLKKQKKEDKFSIYPLFI